MRTRLLVLAKQYAMTETHHSCKASSIPSAAVGHAVPVSSIEVLLGGGLVPGSGWADLQRLGYPPAAIASSVIVLQWLLPADFVLFVFLCSVCTLSSMKRNHLQLENVCQTDMLWLQSVSCSCSCFFGVCVRRWSRRSCVLQDKAELWVGSCTYLSYLIMSQQSPMTCTSSRYVNCPSEVEGERVECLSALLGQGQSVLHFCAEIFNS